MKHYLSAAIVLLLITACQKDNDDNSPAVPLVKAISIDGGAPVQYVYNSSGKLQKATYPNGGTVTYVYAPGKLNLYGVQANGVKDTNIYTLDANGYAAKWTNPTITYSQYYEIRPDGYITRWYNDIVPASSAGEKRYYYNAVTGVLDSTRSFAGGVLESTSTYTYYTDKLYTISNRNNGLLYGDMHKYPPKKITTKKPNGSTETIDYTYTYDAQGRITKQVVAASGSPAYENAFTYY